MESSEINPSITAVELEPRLAYSRFGSDVPRLVSTDAATALCVSDRVLALGTASGAVHILDYEGNRINTFKDHSAAAVSDLSFDDAAESLAVAYVDGHIVVRGVFTDEVSHFTTKHCVTTLAIDPRYSSRKTQEFTYGTANGYLILSSRGWLGNTETVLFQGRGPVHAVRRAGSLLAWATDSGVRVYDTSTHTRVGKIDRPQFSTSLLASSGVSGQRNQSRVVKNLDFNNESSMLHAGDENAVPAQPSSSSSGNVAAAPVSCNCVIEWSGQRHLLLGWGSRVLLASVVDIPITTTNTNNNTYKNNRTAPSPVKPGSSSGGGGVSAAAAMAKWQLQISAEFDVSSGLVVAGIAPFGRQIAVLTWDYRQSSSRIGNATDGNQSENSTETATSTSTSPAALRIYDAAGKELFVDPLELSGLDTPSSRLSPPQVKLTGYHHQCHLLGATTTTASGEQPFQWWPDGAEPAYYISARKDVVLGRPRTSADRISWLSERQRFTEALAIAQSPDAVSSLPSGTFSELADAYLQHLITTKQYSKAAEMCRELLGQDVSAWERWIYIFAQESQLPLLAPLLPTTAPRLLSASAYDLALSACLRSPEDQETLLKLVKSWPVGLYDPDALLKKVQVRLRPSSATATPANTNAATTTTNYLRGISAALCSQLGDHPAALRILLDIQSPEALDYVQAHALAPEAATMASKLIEIDEVRGIALLVDAWDEALPSAVVASLQQVISLHTSADVGGGGAGGGDGCKNATVTIDATSSATEQQNQPSPQYFYSLWRKRLYHYLDWLWQREPSAASPFAALHIELCADHEPHRLLALLTSSSSYPLDKTLRICESRGLVRESVYVLGRMGSSEAALRLIVEQLRDVGAAVEFVQESRDAELTTLLISLALGDATLAGELLDHAGGAIDALALVKSLPDTMKIDSLKHRLLALMGDTRAATALQRGCNAALRADCLELADKLYAEVRRAMHDVRLEVEVAVAVQGEQGSSGVQITSSNDATTSALLSPRRRNLTPPASVHTSPSKFPPPRVRD